MHQQPRACPHAVAVLLSSLFNPRRWRGRVWSRCPFCTVLTLEGPPRCLSVPGLRCWLEITCSGDEEGPGQAHRYRVSPTKTRGFLRQGERYPCHAPTQDRRRVGKATRCSLPRRRPVAWEEQVLQVLCKFHGEPVPVSRGFTPPQQLATTTLQSTCSQVVTCSQG